MPLQSIKRTVIPGVEPSHYPGRYEEIWPEMHLKTAFVNVAGHVRVALVDSGVPHSHPGSGGPDRDDDGHATHVIGTILGRRPNKELHVDVQPIKGFSAQGWPTSRRCAAAIRQAAKVGAGVIVLPWDVGHGTDDLKQAIADLQNAVVVIAAGNWSLDNDKHPNWPASCGEMDHVLTVMATNQDDERASYSSYGRKSVYIGAPGYAVVQGSHFSSKLRHGSLRDGYRVFRGTSAAAAHVARLAALVRAKHRAANPIEVKKLIGAGARRVPALARYCSQGAIADFDFTLN